MDQARPAAKWFEIAAGSDLIQRITRAISRSFESTCSECTCRSHTFTMSDQGSIKSMSSLQRLDEAVGRYVAGPAQAGESSRTIMRIGE